MLQRIDDLPIYVREAPASAISAVIDEVSSAPAAPPDGSSATARATMTSGGSARA
jgi:hypothetical protein